VAALAVVAAIAVVALLVVPRLLPSGHGPSADVDVPESLPGADRYADTGATVGSTEAIDPGEGAGVSGDASQTDKELEEEADRMLEELLEGVEDDGGSQPRGTSNTQDADTTASVSPANHDTSETPRISEFDWFSSDLRDGNAPANPPAITSFGQVSGGWKAYIYNYPIPGNDYSMPSEELLNVYIGGTEQQTAVTLDWYYTRLGSGEAYENTAPSYEYAGSFSGGQLTVTGTGSILLTKFWEEDVRQYAIGRIDWPDAADATIALTRP